MGRDAYIQGLESCWRNARRRIRRLSERGVYTRRGRNRKTKTSFKRRQVLSSNNKCPLQSASQRLCILRRGEQQTLCNAARVNVLVAHACLSRQTRWNLLPR